MAQFLGFGTGKDGPVPATGVINSYAAMTGNAGSPIVTTTLPVAPKDFVLLHQSQKTGAGNWEIVSVKEVGNGQFTADQTLVNNYTSGAQAVKVPQYTGGTISGTITASAWDGTKGGIVALCSNGILKINGSIDVEGKGFRGGTAGAYGDYPQGGCGESYNDGWNTLQKTPNAGGGGGGWDSAGGGGGYGTLGEDGEPHGNNEGQGGASYGSSDLSTLFFGSGGGKGIAGSGDHDGGAGGGIIILFVKKIEITGTINCNGGNSVGTLAGPPCSPCGGRGGGGGAGGSVLIRAQEAILGTNLITSIGGTQWCEESCSGVGKGGVGRIRIEACSLTGSTDPTASTSVGGQNWCFMSGGIL